jgi:hypothetical protein
MTLRNDIEKATTKAENKITPLRRDIDAAAKKVEGFTRGTGKKATGSAAVGGGT